MELALWRIPFQRQPAKESRPGRCSGFFFRAANYTHIEYKGSYAVLLLRFSGAGTIGRTDIQPHFY